MRRHCSTSLLLALLFSGCTAGEVELYAPEGSGLGQGLTVKVELEAADAEIGEALGWSEGVPEAEVRVHRIGTDFSWQTALTDSSGVAQFPHLLVGSYRVAAYRVLTDEEAQRLGGRRRGFGDGRIISLSGPRALTLTLALDQRGSLLISEVYGMEGFLPDGVYRYHAYLEVYNNSDTTVYLDGKILGRGYDINRAYTGGYWNCERTLAFRIDPDGVWARWFHQFPGSGTDYPLGPGEIAVVAMDAIDHSQVCSTLPDLSSANFELLGPADVDNPAVPNMPEIGLAYYFDGHGSTLWVMHPVFLSESVDVETLPRMTDPWGRVPYEFVRFPREALLDVLATEASDVYSEERWPPCPEGMVHRDFDRLAGGFVTLVWDLEYSAQRLVLDVTPDGRAILQDTNTSAVDLIRAPYTVGTLPPQN